jgi:hypothetical protein
VTVDRTLSSARPKLVQSGFLQPFAWNEFQGVGTISASCRGFFWGEIDTKRSAQERHAKPLI